MDKRIRKVTYPNTTFNEVEEEYEGEESMKLGLNTMSFCYTFEYEHDTVFFSYFQPYTLSDVQDLLFAL